MMSATSSSANDCSDVCSSRYRGMDYLSTEPLLQDPTWVASELQSGQQVPTYSYARNNPVSLADPAGREAENPNCTRVYYGSDGRTPGRTGRPNSGSQGDLQCQCLMREKTPAGANTCYDQLFNFTVQDADCAPTLSNGLSDCPTHCEKLVKDSGGDPEASGWRATVCPSESALSCSGGPQIKKFVKSIFWSGHP